MAVLSKSLDCWRDRRVLVTGHTGFKGAWLALLLQRLGARVIGLSLVPDTPSLFDQAGLSRRLYGHHVADLRDPRAVASIVAAAEPEIVFHLAAQSLVRDAFRQPLDTFATNVMGTANLFEALRSCRSLKAVLTATTDKVYFNSESGRHFVETDGLGGLEPYSASKVGAEWVVAAYHRSYLAPRGVVSLVARAGNIVGGGDWARDRLIPDAVRAAQAGRQLEVRNPGSVRPWQYVLDALTGYLILIEYGLAQPPSPEQPHLAAFNFGPLAERPGARVADVCAWIAAAWPGGFRWVAMPDAQAIQESGLLYLDSDKSLRELGWRPRLTPLAAVQATLSWYAAAHAGHDPAALCDEQIEDHLANATARE